MTAMTQLIDRSTACYRHSDVATRLRCNRCDRPICVKCAKRTAVGYKCSICVRGIQDTYFNSRPWDYLLAGLIALPLSLLVAGLFTFLIGGLIYFSWFVSFLAAPTAASFVAETVRRGLQRRRSRYLRHVVAGCFVAGTVPFLLISGMISGVLAEFNPDFYDYGLIEPSILLFVGVSTIMSRLR